MEVKPYLPHEIVENILSRIPVKYLFRFKSVCKQWNSTISDPTFSQIHLKQSKPRSLFAWEEECDFEGFYITKLQNDKFHFVSEFEQLGKFQFVSVIEYQWEERELAMSIERKFVCYCDGLYLRRFQDRDDKHISNYILWNPSTRTYKKLSCPYLIDDHRHVVFYGIGYDPMMKDYKIVIGDMKHYAVFLCGNNKWGEVKEMEEYFSCDDEWYLANSWISFKGCFYWMPRFAEDEGLNHEFEIICFDFGDEKMKKVHKPDIEVNGYDSLYLVSIGGHLCLLVMKYKLNQMRIMKKVEEEDSWIEFKVLDHLPCYSTSLSSGCICSINENEIIYSRGTCGIYCLYDQSNDTFVEIEINRHRSYSNDAVPYLENPFLL